MDVRLVVAEGPARTRAVRLHSAKILVGRRHGCGLRIPSAEVSRRHCLLRTEDGYLTVEDLQSANGTYLNGRAVAATEVVRPGDRLQIGPVTFVVEYRLTRAAADRLGGRAADDAEPVEIVEEDSGLAEEEPIVAADAEFAEVELLEADDAPLPVEEGELGLLPEGDNLRDILSQIEEDASSEPRAKKPRRRRD